MSTTLSFGPVTMVFPWTYQNILVPGNSKNATNWTYPSQALANGTGAAQADTFYAAQLNIAASANTVLNLSALTDYFGNSIAFARLKAWYYENSSSSLASSIAIGNAAATAWTGGFISSGSTTLTLRNGTFMSVGVDQSATGYVTSSNPSIKILNNDATNFALTNVGFAGASV